MNKALGTALAIILVAGAAGGGYWFGMKRPAPMAAGAVSPAGKSSASGPVSAANARPAPAAADPVDVVTTRLEVVSLPQAITAVGSLRSDESVTVRPEVAGRITEILFQEGQRVVKGAPLIKLDSTIGQAETRQARANLTLARSKYDRSVELAGRNFISGQAKDEARNNYDIAAASLALAEARLAKTEIKAPFSGIIGLRSVSVGDYVREGNDIARLEAIDPLKVDIRLPEIYLRDVQAGQSIQIALDALPGRTYDGKVVALDPLVDAAGRSIVIRAQVRNQDTTMRPGMFARVRLITKVTTDALLAPEEAMVPQGPDQYVFKITDGRAYRTKVTTGQRREGKVEVISGLDRNDIIVSAGQAKLRDGTPIRSAAAAPGGRPSGAQDGSNGANAGSEPRAIARAQRIPG